MAADDEIDLNVNITTPPPAAGSAPPVPPAGGYLGQGGEGLADALRRLGIDPARPFDPRKVAPPPLTPPPDESAKRVREEADAHVREFRRRRGEEEEVRRREAQDRADREHTLRELRGRVPAVHPEKVTTVHPVKAPTVPGLADLLSGRGGGVGGLIRSLGGLGAEGGAAAAGGLAGAAGPAAAILVASKIATDLIGKEIEKPHRFFREQLNAAAAGAAGLARNDPGPAAEGAANAMADLAEKTGVAGKAFAESTRTALAMAKAFNDTKNAFLERARELSPYHGGLAAATAQLDVARLRADIREAQQLGPSLARMTDAQSRLEQQQRELLLPIKKALIDTITPILEGMSASLEVIAAAQGVANEHRVATRAGVTSLSPALGYILNVRDAVNWFLGREQDKEAQENPNQDFLDALRRGRPRAEEPSRVEAHQRLAIPLLEGR